MTFTECQGGYVIGKTYVEVQAKKRGGGKLFKRPFPLPVDSTLEFLGGGGDAPVRVLGEEMLQLWRNSEYLKLVNLSCVTLSKPILFNV